MTPTEDPSITRQRMEQRALVDILKGDLTKIRTRVGATDYQKIDQHLEGVLAMERRLVAPTTTTPPPPPASAKIPATNTPRLAAWHFSRVSS